MAAPLRNLNVSVSDQQGTPLPGVAGTLMGGGIAPQLQVSDAGGNCSYPGLAPGSYRLLTALEGFNTKSTSVTMTAASDTSLAVTMNVVNEDGPADGGQSFYRVLTGLQYLFLAALGGLFGYVLYKGISSAKFDLTDNDSARGMITFLVAFVTVGIALILVMAAFMSGGKDVEKRLNFGKDVLTVLIGVLGTIMGFYYGQEAGEKRAANQEQTAGRTGDASGRRQTILIADPQLSPAAPRAGGEFTLNTTFGGGEGPYTYTVTFDPPGAVTTPAAAVASNDGKVSHRFTAAANQAPGTAVSYRIEVTDKNQAKATYDKGAFTLAP